MGLELEGELEVDLGAGVGAGMELAVELVDLGAGVVGGAETREIPLDPPQNAILGQNGASGPKRPFPPYATALPGATFKTGKCCTCCRRPAIQFPFSVEASH